MIVGCYSLDLYCARGPNNGKNAAPTCKGLNPGQFTGRTEAECKREARSKGWRFLIVKGDVVCPWCARASARPR